MKIQQPYAKVFTYQHTEQSPHEANSMVTIEVGCMAITMQELQLCPTWQLRDVSGPLRNDLVFVVPFPLAALDPCYFMWQRHCEKTQQTYDTMRGFFATQSQLRAILPGSHKATCVLDACWRDWQKVLAERDSFPWDTQHILTLINSAMREQFGSCWPAEEYHNAN